MTLIGKWRKYAGDRVERPGKRVCIWEDSCGDRLYAYVVPCPNLGLDYWTARFEVAHPGEIEDRTIGEFATEREAMAAVRNHEHEGA